MVTVQCMHVYAQLHKYMHTHVRAHVHSTAYTRVHVFPTCAHVPHVHAHACVHVCVLQLFATKMFVPFIQIIILQFITQEILTLTWFFIRFAIIPIA